jgi:hypothetical protein
MAFAAAIPLLLVGGWLVAAHWPYRYRQIRPLVEDVFGSQVKIARYHRTYFPHPGFMATNITIARNSAPDQSPLGTVQSILVQGRWSDLFLLRRRVRLVEMTGAHIVIPPVGSKANREDFPPGSASGFGGPETAIESLQIHDSLLEVQHDDGESFRFPIRELQINGLQKGQPLHYAIDMRNAIPHGRITATGSFGPLNAKDVGATPISGQFTFTGVELHDVGDIRGTLSASGRFTGTLKAIQADAISHTPDFAVDDGHATFVDGKVHCTINGQNGDVLLHQIELRTGRTTIRARGQVAGSPKVANLDIFLDGGRAEDVLRPFIQNEVPILGPVTLHSHAYVGPSGAGAPFLQRLHVEGAFDLSAGRLTDSKSRQALTAFSRRAQSPKPDGPSPGDASQDVFSSLEGPAAIRNGIIATPGLFFHISGAKAKLAGTFALHGEAAHLTGNLAMQTDISHAATGFKSFLLKPLAPFFKKRHAGAVIPIAVLGTPGHYKVTQDLSHRK